MVFPSKASEAASGNRVSSPARNILRGDGPELPELAEGWIGMLCQQLLDLDDKAQWYARQIAAAPVQTIAIFICADQMISRGGAVRPTAQISSFAERFRTAGT